MPHLIPTPAEVSGFWALLSLPVPEGKRLDYHIEEFKALKSEIAELVKASSAYLAYALVASGGIYSWLLTSKCPEGNAPLMMFDPLVIRWAWLIPVLITFSFGILAGLSYRRIGLKGSYLRTLEEFYAFRPLGWEQMFAQRERTLGMMHAAIWFVLFAVNLFVICRMWNVQACGG